MIGPPLVFYLRQVDSDLTNNIKIIAANGIIGSRVSFRDFPKL